jgi:hypothetical protein
MLTRLICSPTSLVADTTSSHGRERPCSRNSKLAWPTCEYHFYMAVVFVPTHCHSQVFWQPRWGEYSLQSIKGYWLKKLISSAQFRIKKRILCDHCRGSGAASDGDIKTCTGCNGNGIKLVKQQVFPGMFAQTQVQCVVYSFVRFVAHALNTCLLTFQVQRMWRPR